VNSDDSEELSLCTINNPYAHNNATGITKAVHTKLHNCCGGVVSFNFKMMILYVGVDLSTNGGFQPRVFMI
jgi:hypothetical protein